MVRQKEILGSNVRIGILLVGLGIDGVEDRMRAY